jgi:hypothetical protein
MKIRKYKKLLTYGILILFFGAAVVPNISGNIVKNYFEQLEENYSSIPLNDDYINSYHHLMNMMEQDMELLGIQMDILVVVLSLME